MKETLDLMNPENKLCSTVTKMQQSLILYLCYLHFNSTRINAELAEYY